MFLTYLSALFMVVYTSSFAVHDYLIALFNKWLWLWLLVFTNNFFSLIFFIEILSVSVMLLLTTSIFTSVHFYSATSYSQHSYFQHSYPTTFLQTLIIFFWMTLVSSLILFFFLIYFYLTVLTFDLNLIGTLFVFISSSLEVSSMISLSITWFLFVICVFIKGGIVPFYLWKPSFFKGISLLPLFFYIYIYYFTLFVYLTYFMICLLNELLLFNFYLTLGLISLGAIVIGGLLFESYYVKSFLALSSILNSLIVLFTLTGLNSTLGMVSL